MPGPVNAGHSHRVRVEPAGVEVEVLVGETLFDAAWRAGYDWPTICGGQGRCTYCHVRIRPGDEDAGAPAPAEDEHRALRRVARRLYDGDLTGLRLACRLQPAGDVVVEQPDFGGQRRPMSAKDAQGQELPQ